MHLMTLGYAWRLAPEVLNYQLAVPPRTVSPAATALGVWAIDGALPPSLLRAASSFLCPTSTFWSEHDYSVHLGFPRPYFSYLHKVSEVQRRSTALEQLLERLYTLALSRTPAVKEAQYIEWWAHCRPHAAGHQMHFDSEDEGLTDGGVRHPILSTVLYLTGDPPAGLGGPTLVTDQTLASDTLATRGWLLHPAYNRLAAFDGRLLHGVVPGRGCPPPSSAAAGEYCSLQCMCMCSAAYSQSPPVAVLYACLLFCFFY